LRFIIFPPFGIITAAIRKICLTAERKKERKKERKRQKQTDKHTNILTNTYPKLKTSLFWDLMLCIPFKVKSLFGRKCPHHLQG
jgi:hypothetical protein